MPYRLRTISGANAAAIAEEVRSELNAAFSANARWTKVTSGYTGNSAWSFIDVWQNSGVNSGGYPWFVVVAKSASTANCLLGGALEYNPATFTARKALRTIGTYVNNDGYPVTGSGSSVEQDFLLSNAAPQMANGTILNLGHANTAPTAPVADDWLRVLVTDEVAWYAWGQAATLVNAHGVGVYQNIHSATADQKPLGAIGTTNTTGANNMAGSVWRDPGVSSTGYPVDVWSSTYGFTYGAMTAMFGSVGAAYGSSLSLPLGSRLMLPRIGYERRESPSSTETKGGVLGIAPADFLVFDRMSTVQIGDTVTVGGQIYASVCPPLDKGGLFVNTQPES